MIKNAVIVGDNITPERYNAEDQPRGSASFVVRSHVICEILRNAQRWVKGYESPQSKAQAYGSLFDCLLLTPFQWPKRYAVVPGDAPKKPSKTQINAEKPSPKTIAAIAWWDKWNKEHAGVEIVSQDDNAKAHAAIARLREDKMIAELIDASAHQLMIVAEWHDRATGLVVPMKCLIDVVPPASHPVFSNSLWDTKTTQNASPRSFSMDAMKYGYANQGALYLDLFNAATGEQRSDFGHIVQESYHPFEYRTPPPLLSQRFLGHGRLLYQRALSIYCKALQSGAWPSYDKGKEWPLTDCADWFLSAESLFDEIEEEPEAEEAPKEEEADVIP